MSAIGAAALQANTHVKNFSVTDTAGLVMAALDSLNANTKLTTITVTNASTPLTLTSHQLIADSTALAKIITGVTFNVTGAAVGDLNAIGANARVKTIQVSDTAANVAAGLLALNGNSLVTSIVLTGGTALAVSFAQFAAYGTALGKLSTSDTLSVTAVSAANAAGVQGNGHVMSFSVVDTGSAIVANLDALNADGKLSTIAISDTTTLTVPYTKYIADTTALGKLSGIYTLVVNGALAAGATSVAANSHVSHFTVSDTLSDIGAKLDQLEAAAKTGKLTSITVSDSGGTISIPTAQYTADADAIALMKGSYTITQPSASGAATINLIWDFACTGRAGGVSIRDQLRGAIYRFAHHQSHHDQYRCRLWRGWRIVDGWRRIRRGGPQLGDRGQLRAVQNRSGGSGVIGDRADDRQ